MSTMTRLELFGNLGYKVDPFRAARFDTGDSLRVRRILAMAIESRAMVSIVGPRGIGKTEAVEAVVDRSKYKVVTVEKSDKGKVTIGDIEMAMVLDLDASESPKGGERLSRQLRPILGTASSGKGKVVLLIEEAQRLHANTLKSLKTLREKTWMGEKELFTVILLAQSDPMARAGLSEVRLRTDCVHMQGLSATEAGGYVRAVLGRHFEESAIDALAELPAANNFLELQELCVTVLSHALMSGRELVTVEDVKVLSAEKQAALPRGKAAKAPSAPLSGKAALASVMDKRNAGEVVIESKEAVAC
jgi:type II secretory pathway predicted ATPase ExeA